VSDARRYEAAVVRQPLHGYHQRAHAGGGLR